MRPRISIRACVGPSVRPSVMFLSVLMHHQNRKERGGKNEEEGAGRKEQRGRTNEEEERGESILPSLKEALSIRLSMKKKMTDILYQRYFNLSHYRQFFIRGE